MEPWLVSGLVAGAIGGVVGGLVALVIALVKKPVDCPDCGEPMPRFRKPANRRQALWGGWTCPKCGCEVDRKGRKVEEK